MSAELNFERILEHFYVEGKVADCVRYGEEHINDTFKATMDVEGKELHYILQRINNRLFTDAEKADAEHRTGDRFLPQERGGAGRRPAAGVPEHRAHEGGQNVL